MRKCFVFVLAVASPMIFAGQASATYIDLGKQNAGKVYRACRDAGGHFSFQDGGAYQCTKNNCDGKGGQCQVLCTKDESCGGFTPGSPPPGKYDLIKILKFSPRRPPGPGVLEPTPGASPHGPSGVGTPKPTAPAPVLR